MELQMTDLQQVLVWLASGGAVIALSWLVEFFGWFQAMEPKKKQITFFIICAVVGVLAQLGITYIPANVFDIIAPYFGVVAGIFGLIFLGSEFHAKTKIDE
jgi:membrane protease YdiL (CAAX protease family)